MMLLECSPRQIKMLLRYEFATLEDYYPTSTKKLSTFQVIRQKKALRVVDWYLRDGLTITTIGRKLEVTHQRVSQILSVGIRILIESGSIKSSNKKQAA